MTVVVVVDTDPSVVVVEEDSIVVVMVVVVIGRRWLARVLERMAARWHHPVMQRVVTWGGQLLHSLDTLGRTTRLLPVLVCSVLIWTLYGAVNYVLLGAIGERPSILTALFLLVVLQLGVAVPSSPGRLGVYHYLCIQALAVFGVNGPEALSYAVILHLISVLMPVALGAGLAWRLGIRIWRTTHDMEGA